MTHNIKGYEIKDSGKRQDYASGMRRDLQEGKPDYTLIDKTFLKRLAIHMTKGAEKYGRRNWQLANSREELERFESSALRHMMQWLNGEQDEDHMAAVAFNIAAAEYVKEKLNYGRVEFKVQGTSEVQSDQPTESKVRDVLEDVAHGHTWIVDEKGKAIFCSTCGARA